MNPRSHREMTRVELVQNMHRLELIVRDLDRAVDDLFAMCSAAEFDDQGMVDARSIRIVARHMRGTVQRVHGEQRREAA